MKYSICYIDDRIPVENYPQYFEDTKIINESSLSFLIQNIDIWEEEAVQGLVKELLSRKETLNIAAFKNPSFFINHREEEIYSPQIILYDWDYGFGANSDESEQYLLKILNETFAIVHVFTSADNDGEVTAIISKPEFNTFRDRLNLIRKEDEGSIEAVLTSAFTRWDSNFSYKFGKELLSNAHKALNNILIDISTLSIQQVVSSLGHKQPDGKYAITVNNLIGIISEKFKHELHEQDFTEVNTPITVTEEPDIEVVRKIWGYRLYYRPNDAIVRKGDIITRIADSSKYLVLSSDCHLNSFWNKNYGRISLVPLQKIENTDEFKKQFQAVKADKLKQVKVTSLTNNSGIPDITILPSIPDENGDLSDYLLVPKEIESIFIELPQIQNIDNIKTRLPLLYDYWTEIDINKRLTVSEPFKSPLIQYVMENVSGYGCPDFPNSLQEHLKTTFANAIN